MDDIRRPQHQRRDFAMRHRPHQPRPVEPAAGQAAPQPAYPPAPVQPGYDSAPQPYHQPAADNEESGFAPLAASEDDYEHYSRPAIQPQPRPAAKRKLPKIPLKYAAAGLAAIILISASAYMLTRPAQKSGFTVAQLSKKSTFGFYYPQPLPSGYTYVTKINTFQDGQAYFMLANGSKHIFFHEQASSGKLSSAGLTAPKTVQSPAGQVVMGTQAGQPAAKILAGSTLISVNTTGSVPVADVSQAVNSLKTDR